MPSANRNIWPAARLGLPTQTKAEGIFQDEPQKTPKRSSKNQERLNYIVNGLSRILTEICHDNDKRCPQQSSDRFLKFCSSSIPPINIADYIKRIARYSDMDESCYVLALMHIDRLINEHNLALTTSAFHRLFLTCCVVSAKFHQDVYFTNTLYAKVGGLCTKELNALEIDLLFLLKFDLNYSGNRFRTYYRQLVLHGSSTPSPHRSLKSQDTDFFPQRPSVNSSSSISSDSFSSSCSRHNGFERQTRSSENEYNGQVDEVFVQESNGQPPMQVDYTQEAKPVDFAPYGETVPSFSFCNENGAISAPFPFRAPFAYHPMAFPPQCFAVQPTQHANWDQGHVGMFAVPMTVRGAPYYPVQGYATQLPLASEDTTLMEQPSTVSSTVF